MNNIAINTKFVTQQLVFQVKTAQKFVDLAQLIRRALKMQ